MSARPQLRGTFVALAAGAAILALAPLVAETYTLSVLVIYAILALSLGLIWGFGGILCFGQAAFYGLGAYTYAIAAINIGESTLPVLLGIAVPFAFAFVLGAVMFYGRLSDVYLGVVTLVVTLIFFRFMNATAGPAFAIGEARLGGFNGIPGFPILNVPGQPRWEIYDGAFYAVCAVALLLVYGLVRWLLASPFGRVAVAIRENEGRAELMGYDARLRKTVLFAVGGGIAGLAGVLYASWAEIVTPGLFSLAQSAEIIVWCIVGGLGTLAGPIIGAVVLGYAKFLLGQQSVIDNTLILGAILVLSVLLMPRGIAGVLGAAWGRAPRRARRPRRRAGAPRRLRSLDRA
ncbi:branched-chain amino acid ABC transporter permease [Salinarimonas rosea]|uniref:branched-chain amino acid ABC transporter permease n=1 Tax=Salinarimonas rosea TaxID=552063 RepID=UPI00041D1201|nr:branched-chain amino acid ABC transporter permease [Salinarimonas rosea]